MTCEAQRALRGQKGTAPPKESLATQGRLAGCSSAEQKHVFGTHGLLRFLGVSLNFLASASIIRLPLDGVIGSGPIGTGGTSSGFSWAASRLRKLLMERILSKLFFGLTPLSVSPDFRGLVDRVERDVSFDFRPFQNDPDSVVSPAESLDELLHRLCWGLRLGRRGVAMTARRERMTLSNAFSTDSELVGASEASNFGGEGGEEGNPTGSQRWDAGRRCLGGEGKEPAVGVIGEVGSASCCLTLSIMPEVNWC